MLLVLLCLAFSAASAADATEVYVNNVKLDADYPYWVNNAIVATATEPAGGYNAYFNTAAATLTLLDASVNTVYTFDSNTEESLVHANGDLTVLLAGTNTLSYSSAADTNLYGIYVPGVLTVTGSGSVDMQLQNTNQDTYRVCAIFSITDIYIQGGRFTIDVEAPDYGYGFISQNADMVYSGGYAEVVVSSRASRVVYIRNGSFRMTGGTIRGTISSFSGGSRGFAALNAYLEGGTAVIRALGGTARGLHVYSDGSGELSVSGGDFTFIGDDVALRFGDNAVSVDIADIVEVYVSEAVSGSNLRRWYSAAQGELAMTTTLNSPFKYVRFVVPVNAPQTGDGSTPWMWTGIALCALLFAAGVAAPRSKRALRLDETVGKQGEPSA